VFLALLAALGPGGDRMQNRPVVAVSLPLAFSGRHFPPPGSARGLLWLALLLDGRMKRLLAPARAGFCRRAFAAQVSGLGLGSPGMFSPGDPGRLEQGVAVLEDWGWCGGTVR